MKIFYYFNEYKKGAYTEFCLADDKRWDLAFDEYDGDILCAILNGDFSMVAKYTQNFYLEAAKNHGNKSPKKDESYKKICRILEILENSTLIKSNTSKTHADIAAKNLIDELKDIDIEKYKFIANTVLLNKDEKLNTEQRYLIYSLMNGNYRDFEYNSKSSVDCSIEKETSTEINFSLHEIADDESIIETDKHERLKAYILDNNIQSALDFNYSFESIKDYLNFIFYRMVSTNDTIKICENCKKYFCPYNRSDTLYCNSISPQDPTKTCKEYGAMKTYQDNLKKNEAMGLYRKIYMAKQMQAKRYPDVPGYANSFENYKTKSKQWKKEVKEGAKTEAEYIAWLKDIKGNR